MVGRRPVSRWRARECPPPVREPVAAAFARTRRTNAADVLRSTDSPHPPASALISTMRVCLIEPLDRVQLFERPRRAASVEGARSRSQSKEHRVHEAHPSAHERQAQHLRQGRLGIAAAAVAAQGVAAAVLMTGAGVVAGLAPRRGGVDTDRRLADGEGRGGPRRSSLARSIGTGRAPTVSGRSRAAMSTIGHARGRRPCRGQATQWFMPAAVRPSWPPAARPTERPVAVVVALDVAPRPRPGDEAGGVDKVCTHAAVRIEHQRTLAWSLTIPRGNHRTFVQTWQRSRTGARELTGNIRQRIP
jgi:hypothetical protein